jgi:hypothetical protein
MNDSLTLEPFGFFTRDALRAGWYLMWRQLVRVVPLAVGLSLVGGVLVALGLGVIGALVVGLGLCAAGIWAVVLVPRLAGQWAVATHGYPLTGPVRVWWGITWRVVVASLVAGVILTPPVFVAMSLVTAFPATALGQLGKLLLALSQLANAVVCVYATGWAMSKIAAAQLSGLPLASAAVEPTVGPNAPRTLTETPVPVGASALAAPELESTAAPARAAVAASLPPARALTGAEGRRQCPKCSLYETERGSVIGWYCTICGWRESRR